MEIMGKNSKIETILLTTMQAARALGYTSPRHIMALVKQGHLKARYIPGTRRPKFLRSDLLNLIKDKPYE